MFFLERIRSIKKIDKVLEVGPGYTPFFRSDVLLEKIFENESERLQQSGSKEERDLKKEVVFYKEDTFPFSDFEFDYVICSHVLEHIPKDHISTFISELLRVARAGYIEVPSYCFELVTSLHCHLNLIFVDKKQTIHFLSKEDIDLDNVSYKKLREFFIKMNFNGQIIPLNLDYFGYGFEYKKEINYKIHDTSKSFFEAAEKDEIVYKVMWYKNCKYYLQRVVRFFNENIIKQKIYNKFRISMK
jgi:ubiquinone/menaquinone biosynthesis C-methylase UbiE